MGEAELVQHITKVLANSPQPLRAREIAAQLKKQGIDVDKTAVNSVLYKHEKTMFAKGEGHSWSAVSPAKGSSVKPSPAKGASPTATVNGSSMMPSAKSATKVASAQSSPSAINGSPSRGVKVTEIKKAPPISKVATSAKGAVPKKRAIGVLSDGARKLATQHVSIRVPWHDSGWDGRVCRQPEANTACMVLVNIGEKRRDEHEAKCAGQQIDQLPEKDWPPCVEERATFLAPFEITRTITHPYVKASPSTHGHLKPTKFKVPAYSAPAIPFNWLLRERVVGTEGVPGLAERLQLGFDAEIEPVLDFHEGKGEDGEDKAPAWLNARYNQLCLLDTFFSAIERDMSLCFFYAKRTPLAPEDTRRVIVAVGLVTGIGPAVEYDRNVDDEDCLRAVTFERNVMHSIRPDLKNGFVFPYQALLEKCEEDETLDPASFVAFAPDDDRSQFSYVAEHVSNDAAIGALLSCAGALQRMKGFVPGPWDDVLGWVDRQLNRLWEMRGPCPGMGSALGALGVPNGTLVAHTIAATQAHPNENPWDAFDRALDDPGLLGEGLASNITSDIQRVYRRLKPHRRSLLHLISRFAISEEQATRFYQETARSEAKISTDDAKLIDNPYLMYELDRTVLEPIGLLQIDRGMFPDPIVRGKHPLSAPSALEGPLDGRRVRAFVIDALEQAAADGHTLQLRDRVIHYVRKREVRPELPLSEDVLTTTDVPLMPFVHEIDLADGASSLQLDRFVTTKQVISNEVTKRSSKTAKRHVADHNWQKVIDQQFEGSTGPLDDDEVRARDEKAAALAEIFAARVSVLLGAAGTGKTTLLKSLCELPEVDRGGVLLLAPTGKARVKLETQTKRPGAKTVAQFLLGLERYEPDTGRYFVAPPNMKRNTQHKTVIVDECSMLTEEQLAAILDALANVERLILVGDPRQLPPIGSGRPFVDIVSELAPSDIETTWPRVARSYAELTVSRRQKGTEARDDLVLAQWFSGRTITPGADEVWERLGAGPSERLRLARWDTPAELQRNLLEVIADELKLPASPYDECMFEQSLGAFLFNGNTYFRLAKDGEKSGTCRTEDWQILSPVRAGLHGVDAVNRLVQERFRKRVKGWADIKVFYQRKIPPPMGPQGVLYGDKVISVVNGVRRKCWPKRENKPYVANGDIGLVIGDYKANGVSSIPKHLRVEFVAHADTGITYWSSEFSDNASPPLELAYALTVHKTQGSEFGVTFVIIPKPCRVLSRELLYTALTRQQRKVVLLHQGDVRDLLRFSDASESEIARRCTNLFRAPCMVPVVDRFLEDRLIHRTRRGDRVRSKSEVILADRLHELGVVYAYEQPFIGADGSCRYPDFTVDDPSSGHKVIWEHLGLLSAPRYRLSWERKLEWYARNGVLPGDGGPNGRLVTSADSPGGGIDSKALDEKIRQVFSL